MMEFANLEQKKEQFVTYTTGFYILGDEWPNDSTADDGVMYVPRNGRVLLRGGMTTNTPEERYVITFP